MNRRLALTAIAALVVTAAAPAVAATTSTAAPVQKQIGVASFNTWHDLTVTQARSDARAISSRGGVDIIGWQEAEKLGPIYRTGTGRATSGGRVYSGNLDHGKWTTFVPSGAANAVPVSWRSDQFTLESTAVHLMHSGIAHKFPNRYVVRVRLHDKATGLSVAILNTHLNSSIDANGHPKDNVNTRRAVEHIAKLRDLVKRSTAKVVFVTGDFNIDATDDAKVRDPRFPVRQLGPVATSAWMRYPGDAKPTHGDRRIDYVWVKNASRNHAAFVDSFTVTGLKSDHNALVTKFRVHG